MSETQVGNFDIREPLVHYPVHDDTPVIECLPGLHLPKRGVIIILVAGEMSLHLYCESIIVAYESFYMQFFRKGSPYPGIMVFHALHAGDHKRSVGDFRIRIDVDLKCRHVPCIESVDVIVKCLSMH